MVGDELQWGHIYDGVPRIRNDASSVPGKLDVLGRRGDSWQRVQNILFSMDRDDGPKSSLFQ